jgi:hypothetical protein
MINRPLPQAVPTLDRSILIRNQIDRFYFARFLDSERANAQDVASLKFNLKERSDALSSSGSRNHFH